MLKTGLQRQALCLGFALAALGCGDAGETTSTGSTLPSGTADGGGIPGNLANCPSISTEACTCTGGTASTGTRTCYQGVWTECSCSAAAVTSSGDCKAGHYEGDFWGSYRSGFILGAGIPVFALDPTLEPGLKFTLEEQIGGDAEFPTYVISDGEIKGTADGLFPFNAKLTGTLDCRTKTLTGVMDGGYAILVAATLNEGKFKGPVTGTYDSTTHEFKEGAGNTWTLREEDNLMISVLGMTGGEGTWSAKWVSPP